MKKISILLFIIASLISACGPGQLFGPAFTPTPTSTSTPMPTNTPTITPILTPTLIPTTTATPTPLAGLGLKTSEVVDSFKDLFTFNAIPDIDGNPAQKGVTEEGFSAITLIGAPSLLKAELKIDKSQENSFIATGYWIFFLEVISHGGKEAADWVRDSFPIAMTDGKVEKTFGNARVILESNESGSLFLLTILPKDAQ
jgi:hypothetical protein